MMRPCAGALKVRIRPGQNPLDAKSRESALVAHAAPLMQKQSQGRATRQAAVAVAQRDIDGLPTFAQRSDNAAGVAVGPAARPSVEGVGIAQNL
jgi:hypothetical protein